MNEPARARVGERRGTASAPSSRANDDEGTKPRASNAPDARSVTSTRNANPASVGAFIRKVTPAPAAPAARADPGVGVGGADARGDVGASPAPAHASSSTTANGLPPGAAAGSEGAAS